MENFLKDEFEALYRAESRRVLATLIRLLGDFDHAEEALSEAFAAAVDRWPSEGIPANPRAWLISAGRFKAIDAIRRRARGEAADRETAAAAVTPGREPVSPARDPSTVGDEDVADDQLRLVFTCCHPALAPEGQVALTLREVCGLTTEEIARAFLTTPPTVAQRIVRAKAKIRDERIPYELPAAKDLQDRLEAVFSVVYLVFNEGYAASSGPELTRADLSAEALRLGRLLLTLIPAPEVKGLVALMLLLESRRRARTTPAGELVLLQDQDRALWDAAMITEGESLVVDALRSRRFGRYTLQAAIAAVHAEARDFATTDWPQIVGLYEILERQAPSPVVELNMAVAIAMRDDASAGIARIEAILARGELADYQPAHAAHADLLRRTGRLAEARTAYERALALTHQDPERRFLERRLRDL